MVLLLTTILSSMLTVNLPALFSLRQKHHRLKEMMNELRNPSLIVDSEDSEEGNVSDCPSVVL